MEADNRVVLRAAAGRAVRSHMSRRAHAHIGRLERDPIDLLRNNSEARVTKLIPLRYGRMLASPFAFFRGSAILQAHDLSQIPNTGIVMPICGDGHLANFGGFATPERQLIFDLNDFDEAALGPWEWDLKRLTASFVVAARHMRLGQATASALVEAVVPSYRDRLWQYAQYSALELWYERVTFELMLETAVTPERRALLRHFTTEDLVFKVVGIGSVGTRCLVLLMTDELGKPMFLQIKEARPSVISQYFEAAHLEHEGERVVTEHLYCN